MPKTACLAGDRFLAVCYHDVTERPVAREDFTPEELTKQLALFRDNGYQPVRIGDIEAAAAGKKALPEKALLLTFDDGYLSFYKTVYPILRAFDWPAVLSVVTSWADGRDAPGPPYREKQFLTWDQIREVAASGLVTVVPHSDSMHEFVRSNPQGNIEPSMTTFIFDEKTGGYETEKDYRARIRADMEKTVSVFSERLGSKPTVYTWPYSAYNSIALDEAKRAGFRVFLTVDEGLADTGRLDRVNRIYAQNMIYRGPSFKEDLKGGPADLMPIRAVQIDLDKIVDPASAEESDARLGACLDRLASLGVNTVIVQAFCDTEGTGNVKSVYFATSALPVVMDFLSHAVNRIMARGMQAFVWMPSLAFETPDTAANEALRVRELRGRKVRLSNASYKRLSPFDARSLAVSRQIFRDLAAYVDFDGLLFQDDAYLTDEEDYHPAAAAAFKKKFRMKLSPRALKKKGVMTRWASMKAQAIDTYLADLTGVVRAYRPCAKIARNIYSEVVTNPEATTWFAQDLPSFLRNYDYTVVMAYSRMEKIGGKAKARRWFREMFDRVKTAHGTDKVIFKVQAYDWDKDAWIDESAIKEEIEYLLSLGAKHVAYYPDGVTEDQPEGNGIAPVISGQEYVRDIRRR